MENDVEKIDLDRVDWKSSREFFESLGEALDKLDDKDESYNFTWVGKRKSIIEAGTPINKTLRPDMEASKDFENTKNMLIIGDNLDALKILQESYLGRIKLIYIDPPYNRGEDLVYKDNFHSSKKDYKDSTTDDSGVKLTSEDPMVENSKSNGRFHSDWLTMIYPRLKLAKNLLSEDGAIFISIDDNELANLKKVCDEVFNEDNFIANCFILDNLKGKANDNFITSVGSRLLVYLKDKSSYPEEGFAQIENVFAAKIENKYTEQDEIGFYNGITFKKTGQSKNREDRPFMFYPILEKDTKLYAIEDSEFEKLYDKDTKTFDDSFLEQLKLKYSDYRFILPLDSNGEYLRWTSGFNTFKAKMNEDIYFDGNGVKQKSRPEANEMLQIYSSGTPKSFMYKPSYSIGTQDLVDIIGENDFDFPKPLELLEDILKMTRTGSDDIILDFFAGSGTTAQAVLKANSEDDGNRHFILVQYPEKLKNNPEKTVDETTIKRIRESCEKYNKGKDTGFRVFRVDSNNENEDIRKPLNQIGQSDLFNAIDNVKKDRTPLDLLFGVVYVSALPFDLKLETRKIGENTVYLYGYLDEGTGLAACFDDNIPEETIKEIANLKALTAAFKDSSFADSAAKINLSEHFRIISPDTKVKVL